MSIILKEPKREGLTEEGGILYNPHFDKFYTFFSDRLSYYVIKNDKRLRKKYAKEIRL